MDYKPLLEIGFTLNEAKTYVTLLALKNATVKTISEKTGIHRRNVYDALEKLVGRGLVTSVVVSGAKQFQATNPENILTYLKEKEEQVEKFLPELSQAFQSHQITDEAVVFRGFNGVKAILQDMLKVQRTLYLIGSKGYWKTRPQLKFFYPQFDKKRVQRGIKIRQIFDHELKGQEIARFELGECRFFPKTYSTPIHVWIYGDRVVNVFYGEEPIAFMIKSQKIAAGYKKYFNFMWANLAEK